MFPVSGPRDGFLDYLSSGKAGWVWPRSTEEVLFSFFSSYLCLPSLVSFAGAKAEPGFSARDLKCCSNQFSTDWEGKSHFMVVRAAEDFIAFKSAFEQTSSQIGNLTLQRACLTVPEALKAFLLNNRIWKQVTVYKQIIAYLILLRGYILFMGPFPDFIWFDFMEEVEECLITFFNKYCFSNQVGEKSANQRAFNFHQVFFLERFFHPAIFSVNRWIQMKQSVYKKHSHPRCWEHTFIRGFPEGLAHCLNFSQVTFTGTISVLHPTPPHPHKTQCEQRKKFSTLKIPLGGGGKSTGQTPSCPINMQTWWVAERWELNTEPQLSPSCLKWSRCQHVAIVYPSSFVQNLSVEGAN